MKVALHFNLDVAAFADRRWELLPAAVAVLKTAARMVNALGGIEGQPSYLLPITDAGGRRIGEIVLTGYETIEYPTCAAAEVAFGRTMNWREEHDRYVGYFSTVPVAVVHKPSPSTPTKLEPEEEQDGRKDN
jgi:hypothetical protein